MNSEPDIRSCLKFLDTAEQLLDCCKNEFDKNHLEYRVLIAKTANTQKTISEIRKEILEEIYQRGEIINGDE